MPRSSSLAEASPVKACRCRPDGQPGSARDYRRDGLPTAGPRTVTGPRGSRTGMNAGRARVTPRRLSGWTGGVTGRVAGPAEPCRALPVPLHTALAWLLDHSGPSGTGSDACGRRSGTSSMVLGPLRSALPATRTGPVAACGNGVPARRLLVVARRRRRSMPTAAGASAGAELDRRPTERADSHRPAADD